jgi:hypothetical protein
MDSLSGNHDGIMNLEPRRAAAKRQPHVPNTEVLRLTFASSVS